VRPLPATDPEAGLAAFTVPGAAKAISQQIDSLLGQGGATDVTAKVRAARGGGGDGTDRLVERQRCDYLLPTVIHAPAPDAPLANAEYMFPFVSVVRCPQDRMLSSIGQTLVASAITADPKFSRQLIDAINIDRLNIGAIPTIQLDWLQPHEGNIIEFLFRHRAFQAAEKSVSAA
jgi:hypothetical protein